MRAAHDMVGALDLLYRAFYRGVLARGFALVRDEQGHAIRAAAAVGPGARLNLEFADGRVAATADADRPAATAMDRATRAAERPLPNLVWG